MKNMIEMIKSFLPGVDPSGVDPLKGKYYVRTGSCNRCGKCCTDIYLVHQEKTIDSVELFEALKPENPEYQSFVPVDRDEHGVRFQCVHLTDENLCAAYASRPDFCRKYPSEKSILLGGALAAGCGYRFTPIHPFSEVLQKTAGKQRLKEGRVMT